MKDMSEEEDILINRTMDDDYESVFQKRSGVDNSVIEVSSEKSKSRNHTYKIVLWATLAVVATILLIIVIITLLNTNTYIEDHQQFNMFKSKFIFLFKNLFIFECLNLHNFN